MYIFGARSKKNLDTCHKDLILIAEEALKYSMIDFTIIEGHRSIERQRELFKAGKSKIDGISKKGKHNFSPSMAFDFIAYVEGKDLSYDKYHLMYLVGVFTSIANRLYDEGRIEHKVRSGSNWDGDGELLHDQRFWDMPHIELI